MFSRLLNRNIPKTVHDLNDGSRITFKFNTDFKYDKNDLSSYALSELLEELKQLDQDKKIYDATITIFDKEYKSGTMNTKFGNLDFTESNFDNRFTIVNIDNKGGRKSRKSTKNRKSKKNRKTRRRRRR
jgi:hypothetical protein